MPAPLSPPILRIQSPVFENLAVEVNEPSILPKNKRGRKKIDDYQRKSQEKIEGWEKELENPRLTKEEIKSLKNRISALQNRMEKALILEQAPVMATRFDKLADVICASGNTSVLARNISASLYKGNP